MKKTISVVLLCLALLSTTFLAGCNKNSSGTKGDPTVTKDSVGYPNAKITLTWLPQEAFDSTNKPVADYEKKMAVEFVKKNPQVKIEVTAESVNIQDAMAKIMVQASSGNAPDLAALDSFTVSSYYKYLQPVDDVMATNNLKIDSWFPFAQKVMKPDSKTLAMWYNTDVRVLYYQKSLFPTVPTNWDDLITQMTALHKSGGYMFEYPAGQNETTSCDIWPWFWAQGGKIVDDSGKPVFNEGSNATDMLNTFNFIKKTVDIGITPTRVTTYMTDGDMSQDIAGGKVAAFVGGSWLATQLPAVLGKDVFDKTYAIANIPEVSGSTSTTCSGGWTYGVFTKDSTKRKLAAQFAIDTFISDAGMDGYNEASGNLPVRPDVYTKYNFFKSNSTVQQFSKALETSTVRPNAPIYNYLSTQFQVALANVIDGKSTPQAALDAMSKQVNSEYATKK